MWWEGFWEITRWMGGKKECAKPLQCASLRYYMQFSIHFYPFTSIAGESLQRTSTGEKRRKGKTASVIRSIKTFLPSFKLLFKRVTKNLFFFLRLCLQSSSVFSSLFFLQVGPFDLKAVPRKRKWFKNNSFSAKTVKFPAAGKPNSRINQASDRPFPPNSTSNILIKECEAAVAAFGINFVWFSGKPKVSPSSDGGGRKRGKKG